MNTKGINTPKKDRDGLCFIDTPFSAPPDRHGLAGVLSHASSGLHRYFFSPALLAAVRSAKEGRVKA